MPNWKKLITSGSDSALNALTLSGALTTSAGVQFTGLSTQNSETKSLMITTGGVVGYRTLGSNAFNSTTIPTNNNELDNGAGYVTSNTMGSGFVLEDGDGTEVTITENKEVKFVEGESIDINWTDTSNGSDGDPYDLTFSLKTAGVGSGTYGSTADGTKIDTITVDAYGRITAVATGDTGAGDITGVRLDGDSGSVNATSGNFAAAIAGGNAITTSVSDSTLTIDHDDTSTASSVNNSGNTVIQDITIDTYGHVTGLASKALSIPSAVTDNAELENGAGYTTNTGTVTSVSVGTGLDVSNSTTTPSITLDLSEFTDMTADVVGSADELILLDNGSERRKLINEIKLSQFNNDSGFTSNSGTVTGTGAADRIARWSSSTNISSVSDLTFDGVNLVAGVDGSTGGRVRTGDGSSSSPAFSFVGDTNTGFYCSTTDTIAASTGGTQRLTINSNGLKVNAGSLGVNANADSTNGVIRASNDIIAFYSSDERLKENVKPIENALDKVSKINGVTFDWIEDMQEFHPNEGNDVGVIAQEIEKVLPEVVETRDSGYKAVKYEKIVPLLIESIKDLKAEIEELKGKL